MGVIIVLFIKFDRPEWNEESSFIERLKDSMKLFMDRGIYKAIPIFFHKAFHYPFWTMIFSTCLANSKNIQPDTDRLIGLHGIICGVGSVTSGMIFCYFGHHLTKIQHMAITTILSISVYVSAYLLFPTECSLSEVDTKPDLNWVLVTSFCSGVLDACVMANILTFVVEKYNASSACSVFSVVHFCSALGAMIAYLVAETMPFHPQLFFLIGVSIFSSITFLTTGE